MVVSMGDVAASGGYYIACMADKIYAEPNTITGSIGIFGMIPNAQELMKEKLGITLDTVNIGRFSNSFNIFHEPTAEESAIMQQSLDAGYELFLKRVYEGRGMTRDEVHEIAQGRVWTGTKAKEHRDMTAIPPSVCCFWVYDYDCNSDYYYNYYKVYICGFFRKKISFFHSAQNLLHVHIDIYLSTYITEFKAKKG